MRGRGQISRNFHKREQLTALAAKNQLLALLTGCTDAALAALTQDQLERMYRVPAKEIEYHLTIERQNRARAVAG